MRLLVDENFPRHIFEALREDGHDVIWIGGETSGMPDDAVLALAQSDRRTIVTFDSDFGKLIMLDNQPGYCGIILFRIQDLPPSQRCRFIIDTLKSRNDFIGHFTVVQTREIRQRPLNGGPC
ncbi:Uncharacterised protein [uncultured archaeon]|nr:Uncharacterised protein [uncultured archaeon]